MSNNMTADQVQWERAHQWAVKWDPEGEVEVMKNFADAWAIAQPYPEDDGPAWIYTRKAEIRALFHAGVKKVRVAWVEGNNPQAVWIERLENAIP
jgi:hypothetical protein